MQPNKNIKNRGFIKTIILVIVSLVIIKYVYDINVIDIFTTGKFRIWLDNFYNFSSNIWQKYGSLIKKLFSYILDKIKN